MHAIPYPLSLYPYTLIPYTLYLTPYPQPSTPRLEFFPPHPNRTTMATKSKAAAKRKTAKKTMTPVKRARLMKPEPAKKSAKAKTAENNIAASYNQFKEF